MRHFRFLAAAAACAVLPLPNVFAEDSPQPVELYYVGSSYTNYVSLPDNAPVSYQLPERGSFTLSAANIVDVNNLGSVTLHGTKLYNIKTGETEIRYQSGTVDITAPSGTVYTVTVRDYAAVFAEQTADRYIAENVTEDMSDTEKIAKACEFIAAYDYSPKHSGMTGMIVTGEGGDCWASTYTLNYMCQQMGMTARVRDGKRDPGAGTGHMNSLVQTADGTIYKVECGYTGTAPRPYDIYPLTCEYAYSFLADDTIELTEYNGFDNCVSLPDSIDGLTVTSLGSSCLSTANTYIDGGITELHLPDTLKKLCDSSLYNLSGLTSLELPASVTTIEKAVFNGCSNLELTVAADNPAYTVLDNILYTKDMKTLLMPIAFDRKNDKGNFIEREFTVPEGVEYISDQAFYNSSSLTAVYFPDTLKDIGFQAFCYTKLGNTVVFPESLTGIGCNAFTNSNVKKFIFKGDVCEINNTRQNNLFQKEAGDTLGARDNAFGYQVTVAAHEGSAAHEYAAKYAVRSDGEARYIFELLTDETVTGDVNGDGTVTVADALLLEKYLLGGGKTVSADMNSDGRTDSFDLVLMRRVIVKA